MRYDTTKGSVFALAGDINYHSMSSLPFVLGAAIINFTIFQDGVFDHMMRAFAVWEGKLLEVFKRMWVFGLAYKIRLT